MGGKRKQEVAVRSPSSDFPVAVEDSLVRCGDSSSETVTWKRQFPTGQGQSNIWEAPSPLGEGEGQELHHSFCGEVTGREDAESTV